MSRLTVLRISLQLVVPALSVGNFALLITEKKINGPKRVSLLSTIVRRLVMLFSLFETEKRYGKREKEGGRESARKERERERERERQTDREIT